MAAKKAAKLAVKSAKGEQARQNLKKAALVVLERVGYHKMRIADVTAEAGVAAGLFYHYFSDLKSLTQEVLTDFVGTLKNLEAIEKDVPKGDWYGRIYAHNVFVVKSYAEHPGVMRCMFQLADEDEAFSALIRSTFIEQLNWLVNLMPRLFPDAALGNHQAFMVVYTLASTGEGVLRDYYINNDASLHAENMSVEDIAELLSVIFYRGLFLQHPPLEKLRYTKNLQNMVRVNSATQM
jgi:AcrR family transcriptional regulator